MHSRRVLRISVVVLSLLALVFMLAAARPTQAAPNGDSYIVVLRPGVDSRSAAADMARQHGLGLGFVYSHALNGFSAAVPAGRLNALQNDPRVDYVEADQLWTIQAQQVPTGVYRANANLGNLDIDSTDDLRVDVDVAVIDTGIDFQHPDLNVNTSLSRNCTSGGIFFGSCGSGGDDDHYHGTHVAGTIGALDNGDYVVGVAPGARLISVKVLNSQGSGYTSWIVAGIDYVAANASTIEVANMSLGGQGTSSSYESAIANAVSKGVVFVVAAGNSDMDAAGFTPANVTDVITVSALADFDGAPGGLGSPTCRQDQDDTLADFSNWGSTVEIAAPGVCITSTYPLEQGGLGTISGTSMASPHVAGAAALLASNNNPNSKADVTAIRNTLINSGNFNWTDDSGDGVQEPLLDISGADFTPTFVGGSGGGTTGAMHVGALSGTSQNVSKGWTATITVTVLDADGAPVSGAAVTGNWSGGLSGTGGCTTGADGTCSFTSAKIRTSRTSVTYAVTNITKTGYTYNSAANAATSVTVNKP